MRIGLPLQRSQLQILQCFARESRLLANYPNIANGFRRLINRYSDNYQKPKRKILEDRKLSDCVTLHNVIPKLKGQTKLLLAILSMKINKQYKGRGGEGRGNQKDVHEKN